MSKQQGMALFQVLLMVAIISVLLLVMSQQTRHAVAQAQQMQDQVELQLALDSAAAYTDTLLLSNDWLRARNDSSHPLYNLNFYNYPHALSLPERPAYRALNYQVQLKLQNEASLLDVNYQTQYVEDLLVQLGKPVPEAQRMIRELRNWLQRPKQIFIQSLSELATLDEWTLSDVELLRPYVSINAPILNPVWVPDALLPILLSQGQAATIETLRKNNEVTAGLLQEFAGNYDPLDRGIAPAEAQRMQLIAEPQGLMLYRQLDYRPRHPNPLRLHAKYFQQLQR
ncbi:hypothetical protein IDAT_05735 [Pseudidiomarina atlantica]|jgi:hypothetical protein|uniref:Type II secretion system protein K n=1 Tax=Pseudidiomarina atlantica TaxID=1517416 RepID=A0A094INA7_9GAMM|nr:hypothetical protein [Pseudidiomarina atlantica]KFZ29175.1 hypothetical protein IDAT_05735 [Pseudidiomarina atlantica]